MSLGLRRKALDDIDNDESTDHRREKHPVAKPARRLSDIGIVDEAKLAVIKGVVHESDQRPERDRAQAGHHSDHQCKTAQCEKADFPLVPRSRLSDLDQFWGFK